MAGMWSEDTVAADLPFLKELCRELPKLDLHQHLTGSLPPDGVNKVLQMVEPNLTQYISATPGFATNSSSLRDAWVLLENQCAAVASATADPHHMESLFAKAIESWARDNVLYCEIRVGLKKRPTKRDHLASLTRVIRMQANCFDITPKPNNAGRAPRSPSPEADTDPDPDPNPDHNPDHNPRQNASPTPQCAFS